MDKSICHLSNDFAVKTHHLGNLANRKGINCAVIKTGLFARLFYCHLKYFYNPFCISQAIMVCLQSTAVVTEPTPPGTGVILSTTGSTDAKFTSPQYLPGLSGSSLIPTSITVCPGLTKLLLIILARPTAAIRISAPAHTSGRFSVLEWQMVTVAFSRNKSMATGFPTTNERPRTTVFLPFKGIL